MTFEELLKKKTIILDGATGTNLQKRGMPAGACTETWVLEHPEVLQGLQREYVEAGTEILYAPTFQANCIKLAEIGRENDVAELNKALVAVTKEVAGDRVLVAGDMTMTGQQLEPLGPIGFEQLVSCYAQQAEALDEAGVDVFIVETMLSVQETRAAIIGIRSVSELPIMVSLTFEENGRNLYGTEPLTALITLQDMGIDAFGMNCSAGPEALLPHVERMKKYAKIPLITKANAGLPQFVDGEAVFPMQPEEFAVKTAELVKAGSNFVGGCCGTTPDHIRTLVEHLEAAGLIGNAEETTSDIDYPMVTTERKLYEFEDGFEGLEIGRHITASEDEELTEDLADGMMDTLYDLLDEESDDESDIICVDIDSDAYDPCEVIEEVIQTTAQAMAPVMLSTSNLLLLEKFLRLYPGKALIDVKDEADQATADQLIAQYGAQRFRG